MKVAVYTDLEQHLQVVVLVKVLTALPRYKLTPSNFNLHT
jgi:hypothetical protein